MGKQRRRSDSRSSSAAAAATTSEASSTSTSTSSSSRKPSSSSPWPSVVAPPPAPGTVADVDEIIGVRVVVGEEGRPQAQYLVKWSSATSSKKRKEKKKEGDDDKKKQEEEIDTDPHPAPTWEPTANVADNLLRDYEDRWWKACREGDAESIRKMLAGGAKVLACCVDDSRRSGLHYAAGKGSAESVALLCAAGAKLDLTDKEG